MKLAIWWARRWPEAAGGARGDPGKRRFAGGAVEGAPRACIRTQSAAARPVRVGGTERNARPSRGTHYAFFLARERFACQDASRQREGVEEERLRGGAGAPASAEGAHGEAGQAETAAGPGKATGKRRASGGACPPLACFARRTRSRRAFGMSWFLTPALTRPATPPTRSPRTQAPSARDDPQARNQGYVAHRAPRFARWNRSRPARRAVRRRAETKNPYAASRFVREDVRKMDRLRHPSSAPRRRRTPFRFTHLRVLLRFKSRSPRVPHATHERHARSADGASEPST